MHAGGAVDINSPVILNGGGFTSTSARGGFTQAASAPIVSFAADGSTPANADFSITAAGTINTQLLLTAGNVALSSTGGNIVAAQGLGAKFDGVSQLINNLTVSAPTGSVSMAGVGAHGLTTVDAATVTSLGDIYSEGGARLSARSGGLTLGSVQTLAGGNVDIQAAGAVTLPAGASISSKSASVSITTTVGGVTADGTIAANDPADAANAPTAGNIAIQSAGDVTLSRQLVAFGSTTITSSQGSINLQEALGGSNKDAPLLGSMQLTAWKDIATNGLNLRGASDNTADGLVLQAGTLVTGGVPSLNPDGGKIAVSDRIGVSSGTIRFGLDTADPTLQAAMLDDRYTATLSQGVYARNGGQSITFNVPILTDGIEDPRGVEDADRQSESGNGHAGGEPGCDRRHGADPGGVQEQRPGAWCRSRTPTEIPCRSTTPSPARSWRAASPTASRINQSDGKLNSVCPIAGCPTSAGPDVANETGFATKDYWMIPKIVISNRETNDPVPNDAYGKVTIQKLADAITPEGSKTAALKVIVPASANEAQIIPFNGLSRSNILSSTQVDSIGCAPVCTYFQGVANFQGDLPNSLKTTLVADAPDTTVTNPVSGLVYRNGFIDVPDPEGNNPSLVRFPVQFVLFDGPISSSFTAAKADGFTVLATATDDTGFHSNSTPVNFGNAQAGSASLRDQVLAALVPARGTEVAGGGSTGVGNGGAGGVVVGGSGGKRRRWRNWRQRRQWRHGCRRHRGRTDHRRRGRRRRERRLALQRRRDQRREGQGCGGTAGVVHLRRSVASGRRPNQRRRSRRRRHLGPARCAAAGVPHRLLARQRQPQPRGRGGRRGHCRTSAVARRSPALTGDFVRAAPPPFKCGACHDVA